MYKPGHQWIRGLMPVCLLLIASLLAPPTLGASQNDKPVDFTVRVLLLDLLNIDSSNQFFTANVAMIIRWHDPTLAGSVSEPTIKPLSEVWHPLFQVVNERGVSKTIAPTVVVHPDGTVVQRQRFIGDFSQRLDLRRFPLDTQRLKIRVNAVGSRTDQVRFQTSGAAPSGVADELTISDWEMQGFKLDFTPFQAFADQEPVPSFVFQVDVKRLRGYYILNIFVPLLLIVAMSFLALWVPLAIMNTRVSVSATSMLTLIAYRFMIGGLLPKISYMTKLDTFVMLSTIMVFCTLAIVVLTGLWEAEKPERANQVNLAARRSFPWIFAAIIAVSLVI